LIEEFQADSKADTDKQIKELADKIHVDPEDSENVQLKSEDKSAPEEDDFLELGAESMVTSTVSARALIQAKAFAKIQALSRAGARA
jgi:hypothetical protein